jgi:hypothetical protein
MDEMTLKDERKGDIRPSGVHYRVTPAPSGPNIDVFADELKVEGGALVFWKNGFISVVFAPTAYRNVERV